MPAIFASAVETSPIANTFSCPATCSAGPTVTNPSGRRGREVVAQVVADRTDAEALEPDVRGDLAAGVRRHRERRELAGGRRRQFAKSFAEDELDAEIDELRAKFGAQVGTESVAEHIVGEVKDGDVFVRPLRGDLARELDPDRTRADEEDTVRVRQLVVRGPIVVDRVLGVVRIALGGERVRRSSREDDVIGRDRVARCQHDAMSADLHRAVADHTPVGEEPVVRQEDLGEECRLDEGPQRPDVVHEGVLGLDQHDLDVGVERLGDIDTAVAAADHDDRRPQLLVLVHVWPLSSLL